MPKASIFSGCLFWTALLLVSVVLVSSTANGFERWDTADVGRDGQWTVYNRTDGGAIFGFPLAAGDMNGNGQSDIVLTPMNADSGPGRSRDRAGEVIIVLSPPELRGELDLALLDVDALPEDVTIIYGADPLDFLGTAVVAADLNLDGFADAIVGAQFGDGPDNERPDSGEVVIVWGAADIGGRLIDLRSPEPADAVTFVYGVDSDDRFGVWVSAGDFDGDGIADAILGADQADGPGEARVHAGETYVVYGSADLRERRTIDLAAPEVPVTVVYGIDPEDHFGVTVRAADLNHDGAAELLVGAGVNRASAAVSPDGGFRGHALAGGDGPDNERRNAGEAYVVYGEPGERPATIDLVDPPASTVVIYGVDPFDAYGEELFAGDFNGDGYGDLAIGALTADGRDNELPAAGDLALILGGPSFAGSTIDLADPPADVVFFYGAHGGAIAGDTALFIDVDADGLDELVLASPQGNVGLQREAGTVHVFFGTTDPLPTEIDLVDVGEDWSVLLIEGAETDDMLAYSMSAGDADGDGLGDLVLNVMGGDGFGNLLPEAGDTYVLSGRELTYAAGRVSPCPGDCDGDMEVTVVDLITGVRIILGEGALGDCLALDTNRNGEIGIDELIAAVNVAAQGCG